MNGENENLKNKSLFLSGSILIVQKLSWLKNSQLNSSGTSDIRTNS